MKQLRHVLPIVLFSLFALPIFSQTTRAVGNYAQLTAAITASADGDTIKVTNNIVATAELASAKTIIFNGNNYSISVPNPGLDEAGKFNIVTSAFRVLDLSGSGKTTTINNWVIKGGYLSGSSGAAISVGSGHTLRINNTTISNSRAFSGGGINNGGGTIYMKNCQVLRNAANYGGGFYNAGGGKMFIENSTFSENRSTSSSGGGGAGENNGGTTFLYVNNSTFSNNKSTEIGGALNNVGATIYMLNSSLTGNVAYGEYTGGAIGNNGGNVYAVNSLFAYNYRRETGTVISPTTYLLDDVNAYSAAANVHLYYCIYHASLTSSGVDQVIGNVRYTDTTNGVNNTIFSGGSLSRITDGTGAEIGDPTTGLVFKPFLYDNNGIAPTLKTGSFTLAAGNLGTKVGYTNNGGSPIIGYYNSTTSAWVNLLGSTASSFEITSDQVGTARNNPSAIGAIQGVVDNLAMLKVNYSADGSVSGGTVYGDVYTIGTSITLTAIPNASSSFVRWDYVKGGTGTASTTNPYTLTVDREITVVPVFQTNIPGNYSITYIGNDNTGGTSPATGNYSASTVVAAKGSLTRSGYIFNGWNTNANGSGTSYAAGSNYNASTNITLYAQWNDNFWRGGTNNSFMTAANWGSSVIPSPGDDIVFAEDAVNDLILSQNLVAGDVKFSSANYKIILGNYNLTATSVLNFDATRFVQTNGTGSLSLTVDNLGSKDFPVGRSAYNPVNIKNNTGAPDVFGVQVLDELYLNGSGGTASADPRVKRTWVVNKTNPNAGAGVDLTLNWNAGETSGLTTPTLFSYTGGWYKQLGSTSGTTNSLTYTNYTGSLSSFSVANANFALPVTWLSINAEKSGEKALITWSVASETNNKDFVVERSADGSSWTSLGVVNGALNSLAPIKYHFDDANPASGINYYRVRQRDLDGKSTLSKLVMLSWGSVSKMTVYPNPVTNNILNLRLMRASTIQVIDNFGKTVLTKSYATPGLYMINLQGLSKGVYTISSGKDISTIILQ
ncbi:MAG: InlB B-repeat-containing protein [Chitinophagaceae bacterium]